MIPVLRFFGGDATFHHIGIVVDSIKRISPQIQIVTDEIQKVSVALISLNGLTAELIEPIGEDSPVSNSRKRGIKLVHLCYEVSDIEEALEECRKYGFHCIAKPVKAVAFNNRKIGWVYSKLFGLFELLEK